MQLDQLLNQNTVRQYLDHLKKTGAPPATIDRKLASIRRFSQWAQPAAPTRSDPRGSRISKGSDLTGIRHLYQSYTNSRISSYLHLAILVLFSAAMAVFGYNQIFKEAGLGQAYPQAPSPTTPNRYLSFQARLTDSSDNPITTPTDVRFIIYDDETASGSARLWEELRYIDPDQDGIFSVTLGTETAIASSVFTENTNLWLGVTVETDPEATPRQQIATVGYALNAETLQGFPPSASASADQIPVLTQEGDLVLAAAGPQIYSSSGTFGIKGQAMTITTDTGTNGSITLAPDGTGQLLLNGSTTTQNFIRATNANLTSGHLISGYVGNDTATGDLLNLSSGATEAEKFAVNRSGDTDIAGDLQVNGGQIGISTDTDLLSLAADTLTVNGTLNATTALQTGGTTRVDSSGNLTNIGTTQFNSLTYTWPGSQTASYVLQTNGSGTLSWVDPAGAAAGAIYWNQSSGALFPKNSTVDLLVGGQATTSAKFAVLNMNSGTPVASMSSTYLTSDGTLSTTARQSLTIGNSSSYNTTGNVLINPNGTGNVGIGTTGPNNILTVEKDDSAASNIASQLTIRRKTNSNDRLYIGFHNSLFGTIQAFSEGVGARALVLQPYAGNVGIGTTGPDAKLDSLATSGEQLRLTYTDGTVYTGFTVGSGGDLTIDATGNDVTLSDNVSFGGTTTLNSLTYTWPSSQTASYVLQTNGSGTLSWVDPAGAAAGAIYWNQSSGALFPKNSTVDLLVGGQATTSAKFAVLNMNSGTPVATMSSTYLTSDGTLSTTARQSLTLGNSSTYNTTGNVLINPNGTGNVGIGTTGPGALLHVYSSNSQIAKFERSSASTARLDIAGASTTMLGSETATGGTIFGGSSGYASVFGTQGAYSVQFATSNAVKMTIDSSGNVGIGTTGPDAKLDSLATSGEQLRLTYTDGTVYTGFTVGSGGDLTVDATGNDVTLSDNVSFGGTTTLNSLTYTWPSSQTASYVLQTNGSGTLSWVDPAGAAAGAIYWNQSNGALFPKNSTVDLLVGGQATTSAKFAVLNMNSGTPVASMSSTYWTSDGTLATTARQSLTIGNSSTYNTTGNVLINPNGTGNVGIGTTGPSTSLHVYSGNSQVAKFERSSASTARLDILGASATMLGSENTTGGAIFGGTSGYASVFGTQGAYPVQFATSNAVKMTIDSSGNVGIGTTGPDAKLDSLATSGEQLRLTYTDGTVYTGFTVGSGGDLTVDATGNDVTLSDNVSFGGTTTLNSLTYTWPSSQTASYVLQTDGSGTLSWVDPAGAAAGAIYWNQGSGALYPKNSTVDLLVGGQATTSAKFAVLNMNSGTPVATMSSTYLTSDGTLSTTARQSLTIGNSSSYNTTGNVLINPNGTGNVGIGTTGPGTYDGVPAKVEVKSTSHTGLALNSPLNTLADLMLVEAGTVKWHLLNRGNSGDRFELFEGGVGARVTVLQGGNVGIGTTGPDAALEINHATGDNLRLTYNDSDGSATAYTDFSLGSDGDLTIDSAGGNINLSDVITIDPATTGTHLDFELATQWTTGDLINADYASATTLTGDVVGIDLDLSTNVSGVADGDLTGVRLATPALTSSGATTTNYYGLRLGTAGALDTTAAESLATNVNWYGGYIQMPNIDTGESGDTTTSYGLFIAGGTTTDGAGTENKYGLIVDANAGNVGIGTTTPGAKLEVMSTDYPVIRGTRTTTNTNAAWTGLDFLAKSSNDIVDGFGAGLSLSIQDNAAGPNYIGGMYAVRNGADNSGDLTFWTNNAGSWSEKARITKAGDVGIGTTTAGQKLDVVGGNIRSSAAVLAGSYMLAPSGYYVISTYDGVNSVLGSGSLSFRTSNIDNQMVILSDGNVGIGTTGPDAKLDSLATSGEQLRLTYTDGTVYTGFTVGSGGDLTVDATGNDVTLSDNVSFGGTTTLNSITYTWPGSQTASYVLQTNGSGTLSWVDPAGAAAGAIYWNQSNGALFPKNSTVDLLVGGQATTSAKFAVLNMNSGTPVASISANSGNIATYLTGNGNLATANMQSLTLGSSSTGNILLAPSANHTALAQNNAGGQSAFQVIQQGSGDILTASAGATTRMTLNNNGYLWTQRFVDIANASGTYYLEPAAVDTSLAVAGAISLPESNTLTGVTSYLRLSQGLSVGGADTYYFNSSGTINANAGTFAGTLTANGAINLGNATGDLVAVNTGEWTFSNDTNFALSGGTNGLSFDGTTFSVDAANDWIGIGTAAPGTKLTIADTSGGSGLLITGTSGNQTARLQSVSGYANRAELLLNDGAGGPLTMVKFTSQASTDNYINNGGDLGIGTFYPNALLDVAGTASVSGVLTVGNGTTNTIRPAYGPLTLDYKSGLDSWATALTIQDTTGYVGIGTTSPSAPLHVLSSVSSGETLIAQNSNSNPKLELRSSTGAVRAYLQSVYNSAFYIAQTQAYPLILQTNSTEAMRIDSSQNVGIGTTGPDAKLDSLATSGEQLRLTYTDGTVYTGFTVGSGGDLTVDATGNDVTLSDNVSFGGTTTLNSLTYTWPGSQTANYVLQTNGSGTLSWVDPAGAAAGAIYWNQSSGALFPKNSTVDLLVGGQATTSAKFAVLNMNSGTPVASMSSSYWTSDGTLAATARQSLTIGNSSTYNTSGNVLINPNGTGKVGIGTTNPVYTLDVNSSDSSSFRITYGSVTPLRTSNQMIYFANSRLAINGSQTFGNLYNYNTNEYLKLGNDNTLATNIILTGSANADPNIITFTNNTAETARIDAAGKVGIGTSSPVSKLHVSGISGGLVSLERVSDTITAAQILGSIDFYGNESGDSGQVNAARIVGKADLAWASGDTPSRIDFLTTPDNSATAAVVMTLDSTGYLGIGTNSPAYALDVLASGTGVIARFNSSNTTGCTLATGGTITCTSDIRLKENIAPIDYGLDEIRQITPVAFDWKNQANPRKSLGFIAQAIEQIFPNLVITDPDTGLKQLNSIGLIPVLTRAIQELSDQVNALSDRVNAGRFDRLQAGIISPLPDGKIFLDGPVEIKGDTTIDGTLTASRIESSTIDSLREKIEDLAGNLTSEESVPAAPEASVIDPNTINALNELLARQETASASAEFLDIASVTAQAGFFSEYLAVLGEATVTDLQVTNRITLAKISGLNGTIDLAGNLTVTGNLEVTGNVNILGELTAPTASFSALLAQKLEAETAQIDELTTKQLIIAAAEATPSALPPEASASASIATNATAGKAVLTAGTTEYTIYSPNVDASSLIYVSPIGDPQNQVLYVKAKKAGDWFSVAINQPLDHDLEFNWWIIKLE